MGNNIIKAMAVTAPVALVGAGSTLLIAVESSIAVSTFVIATAGIGAIVLGVVGAAATLYVT